jgi:hypothetical protein
MTVYSCPWCGGDLDREPFTWYCRDCQASFTNNVIARGDPDD